MKNCPACNFTVEDDAAFCPKCGSRLLQQESYSSQYNQSNQYSQPYNYTPQQPKSNPAVKQLSAKSALSSPLALAATIFLSLACILGYVYAVLAATGNFSIMDYENDFKINDLNVFLRNYSITFNDLNTTYSFSLAFGSVLSSTFLLLTVIGMWLTYGSASGTRSGGPVKTGGLSLIKAMIIVKLILCCVALLAPVILLGCSLVIFIAAGDSGDDMYFFVSAIFAVVGVLLLVYFILSIIFYAKGCKTINVMRSDLRGETVFSKVSAFVAVMLIIFGICNLLGVIGTVTAGSEINIVYVAQTACAGIGELLLGVLISGYESKTKSAYSENVR